MRHNKIVAWIIVLCSMPLHWKNILVCKIKGHDLEDRGCATPETGYIDMTCRRCGFSYPRHILY